MPPKKSVRTTGIVFRHRGRCWFAELSGDFICRGEVRAIHDPEGSFNDLDAHRLAIVDAVIGRQDVRLRPRTQLLLPFVIADMVRDCEGLEVLQQLINDARRTS